MPDRNLISVFSIHSFFPNELCNEVFFSKNFVTNLAQMMHFMVINRYKYHSIRLQ